MSAMQAQPCDNTLPRQLTILPQKLKQSAVPWATHFVGKGHLGCEAVPPPPMHTRAVLPHSLSHTLP